MGPRARAGSSRRARQRGAARAGSSSTRSPRAIPSRSHPRSATSAPDTTTCWSTWRASTATRESASTSRSPSSTRTLSRRSAISSITPSCFRCSSPREPRSAARRQLPQEPERHPEVSSALAPKTSPGARPAARKGNGEEDRRTIRRRPRRSRKPRASTLEENGYDTTSYQSGGARAGQSRMIDPSRSGSDTRIVFECVPVVTATGIRVRLIRSYDGAGALRVVGSASVPVGALVSSGDITTTEITTTHPVTTCTRSMAEPPGTRRPIATEPRATSWRALTSAAAADRWVGPASGNLGVDRRRVWALPGKRRADGVATAASSSTGSSPAP